MRLFAEHARGGGAVLNKSAGPASPVACTMHLVVVNGFTVPPVPGLTTSSNIYATNLGLTWKKQGHAVTLFCTDRGAGRYDYVDEMCVGMSQIPPRPPLPGQLRVVVPDPLKLPLTSLDVRSQSYSESGGLAGRFGMIPGSPTLTDTEAAEFVSKATAAVRLVISTHFAERLVFFHVLGTPINILAALGSTPVPLALRVSGGLVKSTLSPYDKDSISAFAVAQSICCSSKDVLQQLLTVLGEDGCELAGIHKTGKVEVLPPGINPAPFCRADDDADMRTGSDQVQLDEDARFARDIDRFKSEVQHRIADLPNGRRASDVEGILAKARLHVALQLPLSHVVGLSGEEAEASPVHSILTSAAQSYSQQATDSDLLERWPADFLASDPLLV